MNFLNKLERKYGKFAIRNLMNYIVIINIVGAMIGMVNPAIYYLFLSLDISKVLHGQIWRLVTFVFIPQVSSIADILFFAIEVYLYYMIGNALENAWGAFRFNLYYISGLVLTILGSFIIYFTTSMSPYFGLEYVNQAMFLAFAALYPNMQLLLFFILPIKVKWLGILYGGLMVYNIIQYLLFGQIGIAIAILIAMGNFIIFFLLTRNYKRISPKEYKRKATYRKSMKEANSSGPRHKCAICGRTELDDESLEFRYCSKCDGNYEYCMEHLFTHQHVHK